MKIPTRGESGADVCLFIGLFVFGVDVRPIGADVRPIGEDLVQLVKIGAQLVKIPTLGEDSNSWYRFFNGTSPMQNRAQPLLVDSR